MKPERVCAFTDRVIAIIIMIMALGLPVLGALPITFASPSASIAIYVIVALMWLVPDRRFEGIAE